jgi:NAD(P)H-hydrate epimerase
MPGREILTTQEVRAADRAAISQGTPGFELMLRAGRSVAREIAARWTPRPVLVLCGPGANGGDGYICAKTLQDGGWPVRVASLAQTDKLRGDAALAFDEWAGPVESLGGRVFEGAGLIVDALFGAGLDRPLEARVQTVLRAAERTGAPIVAVDMPSGLSGDLGRPLGHACHAALTVDQAVDFASICCAKYLGLPAPADVSIVYGYVSLSKRLCA